PAVSSRHHGRATLGERAAQRERQAIAGVVLPHAAATIDRDEWPPLPFDPVCHDRRLSHATVGWSQSVSEFEPGRLLSEARRIGEGQGLRFRVVLGGVERPAFAVRFRGVIYGYLNNCRHESLELDFGDAHFFDDAYDALVCCHHGARYRPETGECLGGPCAGGRLTALAVEGRGGERWWPGPRRDSRGPGPGSDSPR